MNQGLAKGMAVHGSGATSVSGVLRDLRNNWSYLKEKWIGLSRNLMQA